MATKEIIFEGRVQGVGFRYTTKELATGFDLCGTVKNLPDGTVQLHLQGDEDEVAEYLDELLNENPVSRLIKNHIVRDIPALTDVRGFKIIS